MSVSLQWLDLSKSHDEPGIVGTTAGAIGCPNGRFSKGSVMMHDPTASAVVDLSPDGILRLGYAFRGSKVLMSAVELDLFTELATAPLNGETLRMKLGLHRRGARDFFDALVALGMLERESGTYRNTPETDFYLDRNKPSYIGGYSILPTSASIRYGTR